MPQPISSLVSQYNMDMRSGAPVTPGQAWLGALAQKPA
jgi:hypothetical protein